MMKKVKLAHLGCGYISQAEHLPSHFLAPNVKVVAIIDSRLSMAKRVADKFGVQAFSNLREANERVSFEAVDIAVPVSFHAILSIEAMEMGKHVLIEKPIARSVSEGKSMLECATRNKVKLMVAYMRRYDADVLKAKEIIDSGELGEIICVHDRFSILGKYKHYYPLAEPSQAIQTEIPHAPGDEIPSGAIRNNLIHHINLLRMLFGEVKSILFVSEKEPQIIYCFENRIIVHQFVALGNGENIRIYGSNGSISFNLWSPHFPTCFPRFLKQSSPDHGEQEIVFPRKNPYTEEIIHFAACILENTEPRTNAADAIKDLELIEMIHRAKNG